MELSQSELTNAPMAQIMISEPCFSWARTAFGMRGPVPVGIRDMGAKVFDIGVEDPTSTISFHTIFINVTSPL